MRQFKPLKGQKHCKAKSKAEKARKKEQKESLIEQERRPRIKRNGVLITNKKNNHERTKRQKNQSIQRMEKEL